MKGGVLSQRQLRVGELVRHALAGVLADHSFADASLNKKLISVTEVRMSADLKIATCFLSVTDSSSPVTDTEMSDLAIETLGSHAKFLRGRISPRLREMKYVPDLRFLRDSSYENFARIDALLKTDRVRADLD